MAAQAESDNIKIQSDQPGNERLRLLVQANLSEATNMAEPSDHISEQETAYPADTIGECKDREEHWREALVGVCARVMGKTEEELRMAFEKEIESGHGEIVGYFDGQCTPRDLTDYAIMLTLKNHDVLSMQNANSWLFNLMDREGRGLVLREEFVRYTPFMKPLADGAVADNLYDALLECQIQMEEEKRNDPNDLSNSERSDRRTFTRVMEHVRKQKGPTRKKLRKAVTRLMNSDRKSTFSGKNPERRCDMTEANSLPETKRVAQEETARSHTAQRTTTPSPTSLKFDTWNKYVKGVQEMLSSGKAEWDNAKQYLGIEMRESLITSQNAVDHSDMWPTLGKLFLSERYLVFFAFIGKNHYVARLGAASVYPRSIPLLMRECIGLKLESEMTTALHGLSISEDIPKDQQTTRASKSGDLSSTSDDANRSGDVVEEHLQAQEESIPQHVDKLMKRYTSGNKDLCFSMIEIGDPKLRDRWIQLIEEVIAAHKLHLTLGFGSSLRSFLPVPSGDAQKDSALFRHSYRTSPFRHDAPPPLLTFPARINIVRYEALLLINSAAEPEHLLVFSHPVHHSKAINWYVESVQAFNGWRSSSWITRAVSAIKENIQINKHIYTLKDEEPLDVTRLGEGIQRFAELIAPVASLMQKFAYIVQWENPAVSVMVLLVCLYFIYMDWIKYLPGLVLLSQSLVMLAIRPNFLGARDSYLGGEGEENMRKRQARVLSVVSKVQGALHGAQNFFTRVNEQLGKVQSLYLWGAADWMCWTALGALTVLGFVLLVATSRILFGILVIVLFTKHFTPPRNPVINFWESVPSNTVVNKATPAKQDSVKRTRGFGRRLKDKNL